MFIAFSCAPVPIGPSQALCQLALASLATYIDA